MLVQALEEALHTTQPLEASSETLYDVWKHQVSLVHHIYANARVFLKAAPSMHSAKFTFRF